MLYLTCTTITSIDLAHYRVSGAKDWVSVKCSTIFIVIGIILKYYSYFVIYFYLVPHFTDTQSLARDTPLCARSILAIVVQVR